MLILDLILAREKEVSTRLSLVDRCLEVNFELCKYVYAVVGCSRLKDTEWFSRQDPYVCVEYGSSKFSTRTCTGLSSFSSFF